MSKLYDLIDIIYDYDALVEHWLDGDIASLYETSDGKSAYDFVDELRNTAFEIIDSLREVLDE